MINPYLLLGLLIAWIASLAGVGAWQNNAGHVAERTVWQTRENIELRTANASILALEEAARTAEKRHANDVNEIATDYERKLSDADKQRAIDLAAVRAGTLRLRDPSAPGLRADQCNVPGLGAGAGERDGGAASELSATAAEFLLGLAAEADDVARQLSAGQEVIKADRAMRF